MLLSHTFTNHYALCASMLWYWIFKLLLTCTCSVIEVLKVKLTLSDSWTKGFHSRAYSLIAVDLLNIRDSNSGIVRRLAAAAWTISIISTRSTSCFPFFSPEGVPPSVWYISVPRSAVYYSIWKYTTCFKTSLVTGLYYCSNDPFESC